MVLYQDQYSQQLMRGREIEIGKGIEVKGKEKESFILNLHLLWECRIEIGKEIGIEKVMVMDLDLDLDMVVEF